MTSGTGSAIISPLKAIAELCNGSTTDSDSVCWGSNPYSAAKRKKPPAVASFFCLRTQRFEPRKSRRDLPSVTRSRKTVCRDKRRDAGFESRRGFERVGSEWTAGGSPEPTLTELNTPAELICVARRASRRAAMLPHCQRTVLPYARSNPYSAVS